MSEDYSQALKNIVEQLKPTLDKFEEVQKTLVSSITKFDFSSPANELLASLTAEVNKQQQLIKSMGYFPADITKELSSISATLAQQPISAITEFSKALKMYGLSSIYDDMPELSDCVSDEDIDEMIKSGDITQEDIASELHSQLNGVDNPIANSKSEKVKKAIQSIIKKLLIGILLLAISPITDTVKDKIIDTFRVDSFWRNTGIIEWIDDLFDNRDSAVSEEEAKASVDLPDSTNISKEKREDLIHKISEIRSFIAKAKQDENTAQLMAYLGDLEKDVNGKKYGLVFEEHREAIDEVLDNYTPVLTEDEDLYINNGGNINFLIEGDNLASLKLLEKTHKGKIDLVYIDPPYNTGNNDFIYNDNYVANDDGFKHSKWCSFMSKRLDIARRLLSDSGVIFIQISDIELSALRMICDEVFGEENFLNIISVNMKNIAGASGGGEDKRFKKNCEYILVYAKNYSIMPLFNGAYTYTEMYSVVEQYKAEGKAWHYTSVIIDKGEKNYIGSTVDGDGNEIRIYTRKNAVIKSIKQIAKDEDISEKDVYYKYGSCIFEAKDAQSSIRTRVSEAKKNFGITDDVVSIEYVPKTGKRKGIVYEQFYKGEKCRLFAWLSDISENIDGILYKKSLQGTYWDFTSKINNLTKEGSVEFANGKKPVDLLTRIISLYPQNDTLVLDFFAGSGTTGHAVLKMNSEDEGHRSFILCTNNENNICRNKTYQRLFNVSKEYPETLKYYKVEYVPIEEKMYYEYADSLLLHIRELVELENGINFNGNAEIAIVLTDEELEDFINSVNENTKCKKLYMGHDLLPNEEQDKVIKDHDIEICIIPDYYYRDLQER